MENSKKCSKIGLIFSIFTISIISSTKSVEIQCIKISNEFFEARVEYFTCTDNSENLFVQKYGRKIEKIIDPKSNRLNSRDIEGLTIEGSKSLKYFPRGAKSFLPSLKGIKVVKTGLSYIDKYDLEEFGSSLNHVILTSNQIFFIPSDLFEYNRNIKRIGLSRNSIKFIDSQFFNHLEQLKQLNYIGFEKSECLDQEWFKVQKNQNKFKWNYKDCESAENYMKTEGLESIHCNKWPVHLANEYSIVDPPPTREQALELIKNLKEFENHLKTDRSSN